MSLSISSCPTRTVLCDQGPLAPDLLSLELVATIGLRSILHWPNGLLWENLCYVPSIFCTKWLSLPPLRVSIFSRVQYQAVLLNDKAVLAGSVLQEAEKQ